MTFEEAKRKYIHRYTMEHVPRWATGSFEGMYYAPQFETDKEWFDNTKFPPDEMCYKSDCYTTGQTWPLGHWLDKPLQEAQNV